MSRKSEIFRKALANLVRSSLDQIAEIALQAPAKTELHGTWYQVVIPIGKDHCAYLTIDDDAIKGGKQQ